MAPPGSLASGVANVLMNLSGQVAFGRTAQRFTRQSRLVHQELLDGDGPKARIDRLAEARERPCQHGAERSGE